MLSDDSVDWHRYRAWLRMLVRSGVDPKLRSKLDPSDLVQQTITQALDSLPSFRGSTEPEFQAWLRTILTRNVTRASRDFTRLRRDVDREIAASIEFSSVQLEGLLVASGPSPIEKAMKTESVLELCDALERLPDSQRQAIHLHHWKRMTINDVADEMGRSPVAVAGLLKRGMKSLRNHLKRTEDQD